MMRHAVRVGLLALSGCALLVPLDDLGDGGSPAEAGEGGCGDTQSSPESCGVCGHSCLGGDCVAGACQPVPLASVQPSAGSIVVDGDFVYWIAGGEIRRIATASIDGGSWSRVGGAGIGGTTGLLAALAPNLYAVTGNTLVTVPESEPSTGNAPSVVASFALKSVSSFGVDTAHDYFYVSSGTLCATSDCVIASAPDGGGEAPVADNLQPGQLVLDEGKVFFFSQGDIESVAVGSPATLLATESAGAPTSIAADDAGVYVTVDTVGLVGAIPRGGLDGGAPVPIASGLSHPRLAASGAGLLAWYTDDGLMACTPSSCSATQRTYVSSSKANVSSIAIDARAIYWTDPSRAGVYKVAR
jgi:hypothetical protein